MYGPKKKEEPKLNDEKYGKIYGRTHGQFGDKENRLEVKSFIRSLKFFCSKLKFILKTERDLRGKIKKAPIVAKSTKMDEIKIKK